MNGLRLIGALLAGLLLFSTPSRAAHVDYFEVGDAGDVLHSQRTVGDGTLDAIHGFIGGVDHEDVFGFKYIKLGDGSVFNARVDSDLIGLLLTLYNADGSPLASGDGSVRQVDLPTGEYHIGLLLPAVLQDPPYNIIFNINPDLADIRPLDVPEPASLAVLGMALGAAGLMRRRRR